MATIFWLSTYGVHIGATWRIRLNCPCAAAMRPCVKLLVIIRPHRTSMYVDVAYCYRPSSVVCRSVTLVSPAKTAEPIEMPMGPWNYVLDGDPNPPWEGAILRGEGASHCKV